MSPALKTPAVQLAVGQSPVMIVGLPRSGTTWLERLFRYGGYVSANECFNSDPGMRARLSGSFQPWDGRSEVLLFVQQCAALAAPSRLVFKVLDEHLSWPQIDRLAAHCDTVVALRHPLAALASWLQAKQTGIWNAVAEDGNQEAIVAHYRPQPVHVPPDMLRRWELRYRQLANFAKGKHIVGYWRIVQEPQAVISDLAIRYGLKWPETPLPRKLNHLPVLQRIANWSSLSILANIALI